jgi:hypothetical protein
MKRNLLVTVLAAALIAACASEPQPAARSSSRAQSASRTPAAETPVRKEAFPEEQDRATEAMNRARSIKANVEFKEEFEAAQALFDEAESLKAVSEEESARKYLEAETRFRAAYETAAAKRNEAQRQLDLALEAIKSLEDAAFGKGAGQ